MNPAYLKPENSKNNKATRDGFGQGLLELGETNKSVVALTADLAESTRSHLFAEKYPKRFFDVGVAEQNLVGMAAGMAHAGVTPFACSFAAFNPGRSFDQVRVSVAYSQLPVVIVGSHAGLTVGEDGATHQALEDVAMMRALPGMAVFVPADAEQARIATHLAATHNGPVYLRLGRMSVPHTTPPNAEHETGKMRTLIEGQDITIIANGTMIHRALEATKTLKEQGVDVRLIDAWCVKPLDTYTIRKAAQQTGAIVVAEEHQTSGGLAGAVAETVAAIHPCPIEVVAVKDTFGESGTGQELLDTYGLTAQAIIAAAIKAMERKAGGPQ